MSVDLPVGSGFSFFFEVQLATSKAEIRREISDFIGEAQGTAFCE